MAPAARSLRARPAPPRRPARRRARGPPPRGTSRPGGCRGSRRTGGASTRRPPGGRGRPPLKSVDRDSGTWWVSSSDLAECRRRAARRRRLPRRASPEPFGENLMHDEARSHIGESPILTNGDPGAFCGARFHSIAQFPTAGGRNLPGESSGADPPSAAGGGAFPPVGSLFPSGFAGRGTGSARGVPTRVRRTTGSGEVETGSCRHPIPSNLLAHRDTYWPPGPAVRAPT